MHKRRFFLRFLPGGGLYVLLELLWRGRSHGSMFFAGGISLVLLGELEERAPRFPFLLRCLLGAGLITAVELGTGLLVNRDYSVWDYRRMPGNFLGQICPAYCLLWLPLSAAGLLLCRRQVRTEK